MPFRLAGEEVALLRSQIVTLKTGSGQHRKYPPYAFTEQVAIFNAILELMTPPPAKKRPIGFGSLWRMADELRGSSMHAAEYKYAVFGLVFLKCIPDALEEHPGTFGSHALITTVVPLLAFSSAGMFAARSREQQA